MITLTVDTDGVSGDYASLSAAIEAVPSSLDDDYTITLSATTSVTDTVATSVITARTHNGYSIVVRQVGSSYIYAPTASPYLDVRTPMTFEAVRFQIPSARWIAGSPGVRVTLDSCYCTGGRSVIQAPQFTVVNCVSIGAERQAFWKADNDGLAYIFNSTVVRANQEDDSYPAIENQNTWSGGRMLYVRNVYAHADYSAAGFSSSGQRSLSNCASYDGSDGTSEVAMSAETGARFLDITPGSEDLRIASGSSLIDAGVDLSDDAAFAFNYDILGVSRPQGAEWDIGAFEFVDGTALPMPQYIYGA